QQQDAGRLSTSKLGYFVLKRAQIISVISNHHSFKVSPKFNTRFTNFLAPISGTLEIQLYFASEYQFPIRPTGQLQLCRFFPRALIPVVFYEVYLLTKKKSQANPPGTHPTRPQTPVARRYTNL